jgi:hypothetical protein
MLLLIVTIIYLSSTLSSLLIVSSSRHKRIVLASDLFFRYSKFLVTGHIRRLNQTYPT